MSIPVPPIPSDNVYKFLTFLGTVLLIFSVAMAPYLRRQWLSFKHERVARAEDKVQAMVIGLSKNRKLADEEVLEIYQQTMGQVANELIEEEAFIEEATRINGFVFWGSIVLMIVGFSAWWWRVQRHQDQLLRYEVAAERLRCSSPEPDGSGPGTSAFRTGVGSG